LQEDRAVVEAEEEPEPHDRELEDDEPEPSRPEEPGELAHRLAALEP